MTTRCVGVAFFIYGVAASALLVAELFGLNLAVSDESLARVFVLDLVILTVIFLRAWDLEIWHPVLPALKNCAKWAWAVWGIALVSMCFGMVATKMRNLPSDGLFLLRSVVLVPTLMILLLMAVGPSNMISVRFRRFWRFPLLESYRFLRKRWIWKRNKARKSTSKAKWR
jgi:hypothetical protein